MLAPDKFLAAPGRAVGCSEAGKLKGCWNAACGEWGLVPTVESPLPKKYLIGRGSCNWNAFWPHPNYFMPRYLVSYFTYSLAVLCHETHFRREWDEFTCNKKEVAASLGQNNGHLPVQCIHHYPALPASLANPLLLHGQPGLLSPHCWVLVHNQLLPLCLQLPGVTYLWLSRVYRAVSPSASVRSFAQDCWSLGRAMRVDPSEVPSASGFPSQGGQKKGHNRDPRQHQNWLHCKAKDSRISGEVGR